MYTTRQQVEGQMLKYFIGQTLEVRRQVLAGVGGDYDEFIKAILTTWEKECSLPADELIQQRLKKVKIHIKAPRLGAHGRLFTLRYWPEAKRLREKGAKYPEIVEYLKIYRKYTISAAYLKRLMEALA
jgi:hypothetical protein